MAGQRGRSPVPTLLARLLVVEATSPWDVGAEVLAVPPLPSWLFPTHPISVHKDVSWPPFQPPLYPKGKGGYGPGKAEFWRLCTTQLLD